MQLNIFLSWSGVRSKHLATALKDWLPRVIQVAKPWMSDDTLIGARWADEIGQNLYKHDIGIICVTPENQGAQWLLFEAGALSKIINESQVCPVLFGLRPQDIEKGPLSQFQMAVFNRDDILKLIYTLNNKLGDEKISEFVLQDAFSRCWPDLEAKVAKIADIPIECDTEALPNTIKVLARCGFPEPSIISSAFFNKGFENHMMYDMVTSASTKKLYSYGRKNRKLFDKQYWDFFETLPKKIRSGFEFKVLFLDPNSPSFILNSSSGDPDFEKQLHQAINQAISTLKRFKLDPDQYCRTYKHHRSTAMIAIDNAVLFKPVRFSEKGLAKRLTGTSFNVVHSHSKVGAELIQDFLCEWNSGNLLTSI